MLKSTAGAIGYAGLFALGLAAAGCDRAKRETTDRLGDPEPSTWTSRSDCEALLSGRTQTRATPRIGTWNIRFFPDSQEEPQSDENKTTDVPWLACAIATIDVDVLAIQEFKATERAIQKQEELVQRLSDLTGGDWQLQIAPCEPAEVQHPGFLYDASRVTGANFREIPVLNPDPICSNEASPGFGGYFSVQGGPDFHFIAVHFQAGDELSSIDRRDYAVSGMQAVIDEAMTLVPDSDVVFAGDFNTAGCVNCDPELSSVEEVTELSQTLSSFKTPLRLIGSSEGCTRHVDNGPPLMDLFVVTQSAAEVPADGRAHVSGICEATGCDRLREWLEDARDRLSDHCPVTIDLMAQDAD